MKNILQYFIVIFVVLLCSKTWAQTNLEQVELNDIAKSDFNQDPCLNQDLFDFLEVEYDVQASYYHHRFVGKKTASGDVFENDLYTAAHRSLPFGTKIRVTNLQNDKTVIVTINDRGPFTKGRSLDLSQAAFLELTNHISKGVVRVKIEKVIENET
ncbi:septal ring lytic transglycosylase RlpA family protein [Myroides sp. LJL119]